jgi:hypothetical protein
MKFKIHPGRLLAALACAALFGACLFQSKDKVANRDGGGWDDFPNADENLCGDVTQDQMTAADSLVAKARPYLDGEAAFVGSDSGQDWSKLKRRDVDSMDAYYTRALDVAPNHCGALFGKSIVTAYAIAQNQAFDSLVDEVQGTDGGRSYELGKLTAEGAAPALLDMQRGLATAPKSALTMAQDVSESVLLPKLDSAIKALETIAAHPAFRFRIDQGEKTWRLDRDEVEPILATLKIAKALAILVAGYAWRTETDESYPYLKTLMHLNLADLDSLKPEQKDALDHYTALLQRGSTFTRIRAGWAERVASIPDLLNQAVEHVQTGLAYGISKSDKPIDKKTDPGVDPYIIGTGENADVDPADLRTAIDRLELVKKYLKGEVPMTYSKGTASLRINFPKLFRIDGLQGLLPYFTFYPYPEWNDSLPADAGHPDPRPKGPFYFTDASGVKLMESAELDGYADDLSGLTGKVIFPDPTMGGIFPDLTNQNIWSKVESLRGLHSRVPDACTSNEPPLDPNFPEPAVTEPCRMPVSPSDLDVIVYYLGMGFF